MYHVRSPPRIGAWSRDVESGHRECRAQTAECGTVCGSRVSAAENVRGRIADVIAALDGANRRLADGAAVIEVSARLRLALGADTRVAARIEADRVRPLLADEAERALLRLQTGGVW